MRKSAFVLLLLLLAGCGGPGGPRWHGDAVNWLDTYRDQALSGAARLAPGAFENALREFRRGADWDGLALAQLTRCAIERAIDQALAGCDAYREQKPLGASRGNDAYANWLAGTPAADDIEFLPPAYRGVAGALTSGDRSQLGARLAAIESPLSRLIALGVVWRQLPDAQAVLADCQTTAARQGWLAAHRSCLARELVVLRERGDADGVRDREKRLRLLGP